ncbi:oxidoreductase [Polynucleobacter sp. SHI8]|jgi:carbon-monoxide dehydrogenase small subunit|uniref:(2Fe-2S)-binding protein n=1 Tax=unclassified Polynucleobacter TaxID=2640945 RepID=UPI002493BEBD|nr:MULTISPECIES: (2Fe-2S)-binding protein [unclassified Polynucleobacter]BDW11262.1 oxidoreductase [Polynucleobacter sp. SHI2]BDW13708.1 oxidoreductase [Polynucleobacter sp. SHI8]
MQTTSITMTLNGQKIHAEVEPRQHLVDFLREDQALTGSHLGCEQGACGACTVKLDGKIVRGCLVLTVQANGSTVETIEGMSASGAYKDLQQAFLKMNALQCGFCTSGMLMAAAELIETQPTATRTEIREWISGNYCRCTGYQAIVDAIAYVLEERQLAKK